MKDISERTEEISDRLFVACGAAQGELEVFETYDLADELNDQRNRFADDLLEIEIAAHDLDELVDSSTSSRRSNRAKGRRREGAPFLSEDTSMPIKPQTTSPQTWTTFHLGAAVRLVAGVHCPNCETELRAWGRDHRPGERPHRAHLLWLPSRHPGHRAEELAEWASTTVSRTSGADRGEARLDERNNIEDEERR